jgi:hypothetical protein
MKARILGWFSIIGLGVDAASARALAADVGLITQLSGPVT